MLCAQNFLIVTTQRGFQANTNYYTVTMRMLGDCQYETVVGKSAKRGDGIIAAVKREKN